MPVLLFFRLTLGIPGLLSKKLSYMIPKYRKRIKTMNRPLSFVSFVTVESQVHYRFGYELREKDVHDVLLLCKTFGLPIPAFALPSRGGF
jgi:hypothetical protein